MSIWYFDILVGMLRGPPPEICGMGGVYPCDFYVTDAYRIGNLNTESFSRVGTPGDNAWSESFFSILKKEIVHWRFYPTRESARQAIYEYIEVFYN